MKKKTKMKEMNEMNEMKEKEKIWSALELIKVKWMQYSSIKICSVAVNH